MPQSKRINFDIPQKLFMEMASIMRARRIKTQADFIREAINKHIKSIRRKELEKELAEGYKANAKLDKKICEEFIYVDSENI